jgi:hypothetical protein
MTFKSHTLARIDAEVCKLENYVDDLVAENERLREREHELIGQLASYVSTVDRMKLELIMAGALVRPEPEGVKTAVLAEVGP